MTININTQFVHMITLSTKKFLCSVKNIKLSYKMPTEIYNQEAKAYLRTHNFHADLTLTANIRRSNTYVITLYIS